MYVIYLERKRRRDPEYFLEFDIDFDAQIYEDIEVPLDFDYYYDDDYLNLQNEDEYEEEEEEICSDYSAEEFYQKDEITL